MREQKFRQLNVWKKAMDVIGDIYAMTGAFPQEEIYGLTNQLRRATVSIALNVAEGSGADSDAEFKRFLMIAARSAYEAMCGIEVAVKLRYVSHQGADEALNRLEEISAMLHGFAKRLRADR